MVLDFTADSFLFLNCTFFFLDFYFPLCLFLEERGLTGCLTHACLQQVYLDLFSTSNYFSLKTPVLTFNIGTKVFLALLTNVDLVIGTSTLSP